MTEQETAEQLTTIARQLLIHGNAEDALALLDSAVALMPDDTDIVALQCEAAHRAGRHEEAHERLAALMPTVSPERRKALSQLDALALLALGRRDEAEAVYRQINGATTHDLFE